MGDFYQNGIITNFHNLKTRDLDELEKELTFFSKQRPMSLVLPSLFSELEGPALSGIVDELKLVPYLSEIVIGLDRADEAQRVDSAPTSDRKWTSRTCSRRRTPGRGSRSGAFAGPGATRSSTG